MRPNQSHCVIQGTWRIGAVLVVAFMQSNLDGRTFNVLMINMTGMATCVIGVYTPEYSATHQGNAGAFTGLLVDVQKR